jgi:Fur family ferric uptake transcriptional regulator
MKMNPASSLLAISELLARRGFRSTAARRAVLDVLLKAASPLSVMEIHKRIKRHRIDLSSVYRTVNLLCELGLFRVVDVSRGSQYVELAESFTGHHHHLICQACGQIGELDGCFLENEVLEAITRQVRQLRNFQVTDHDLRLLGLCEACATT